MLDRSSDPDRIGEHGSGVVSQDPEARRQQILATVVSVHVGVAFMAKSSVDLNKQTAFQIGEVGEEHPSTSGPGRSDHHDGCLSNPPSSADCPEALAQDRFGVASGRPLPSPSSEDDTKTAGQPTAGGRRVQFLQKRLIPNVGTTTIITSQCVFDRQLQGVGVDEASDVEQGAQDGRHPQAVVVVDNFVGAQGG